MTLTVPRSNANGGRAARAAPPAPTDTGAIVAELGQIGQSVGTAIENDRLQRESARNQVDLNREFNDLRLEVEGIGDPDDLDAAWSNGVATIRGRFFGDDAAGVVPRVSERNAEDFALAFDDLAARQGFQVGVRSLKARNSQREATFNQYAFEAGRTAAATSDPESRGRLIAAGHAQIDALLASNAISPEEAQRRREGLGIDIDNAAAIGTLAEDPEAFLAGLQSGDYPNLDGETQARYEVQAKGAIARRDADLARAEEVAAAERDREIGDRLSDIAKVASGMRITGAEIEAIDGRPIDEAFLNRPEVRAHPDFARAQAALSLRNEGWRLNAMTPAALDALIAEEKTRAVEEPWQMERLTLLQDVRGEVATGWREDPVAQARSVPGLDIAALPDLDGSDPQALAGVLQQRAAHGQRMIEGGYATSLRVFDADERVALQAALGPDQSPESRAVLAATLAGALPRSGPDSFENMVDDPVLRHMGTFVATGGSGALAQEVLRGQQAIDLRTVVMPPQAARTGETFEAIGTVFADLPGGTRLQANVMRAADALYARRIGQNAPEDDINPDLYLQAVHDVMGGTGYVHSASAEGGVQEVRDTLTILPRGVNGADVENRLARFPIASGGAGLVSIGGAVDQAATDRVLAAASVVEGALPTIAGEPVSRDIWQDVALEAVGNDQFIFTYPLALGRRTISTAEGRPYVFSLTRLMRELQP